jgi:phosphate starvation-inducible membrane PsiE
VLVNPDAALAIPALVEDGVLPAEAAPRLLRVARGELVSVHAELRFLLYAGVLVLTGGVGLMIKENLDRIGPVVVAALLGLAAAAALAWTARTAPPFSWQEVASPNLAFDYILLLGILLAAADLAYCEAELGLLGAHRSWHLLIVAGLAGLAAFRFDSRVVFSLSLTSFAAWRGVSLADAAGPGWTAGEAWRWNAIACGVVFAGLGLGLARWRRKPHFEPVAVHLGCLLALGGVAAGLERPAWGAALLLAGAGLAAVAYRTRRFPLFAYGVVAAYLGLTRLLLAGVHDFGIGCLWVGLTSILMIAGLLAVQRRMKEAA